MSRLVLFWGGQAGGWRRLLLCRMASFCTDYFACLKIKSCVCIIQFFNNTNKYLLFSLITTFHISPASSVPIHLKHNVISRSVDLYQLWHCYFTDIPICYKWQLDSSVILSECVWACLRLISIADNWVTFNVCAQRYLRWQYFYFTVICGSRCHEL